jgi:hypothetical protein
MGRATTFMFVILLQFLLLTATSAGWAVLLKRFLKIESPWSLSLSTLLFGAGFAVQILLLQNLVYCNIPVQTAFALPAAIGLYGLFLLARNLPPLSPADRNRAAIVLAAVFFIQVFSAFVESPNFFYGKGHTDQFNYTVLSQFVLTQPFHSTAADIHLQPWLTRTHEFKEWRIGQAVAQAYAASLSFSNAKEAYAGISAFCLALLALVTYSLARALAIPANLSLTAALWTGLAPALTRYHLEGFLSQSVSLFILPFLGLWARTTTRKPGYSIVLPAIALAYLLVCYVELLPIGLVAFGALALYLLFRDGVHRVAPAIAAFLLSLLLVPYAVISSYKFLIVQLERAGQRHQSLEAQAALAGTIPGWIQGLADFPFLTYPLQLLTALAITGLAGFAIYKSSRRNGAFLSALLAPPVLLLAYLALQTPLARYPFSKIQDSFVYLWILLPVAGLSRLRQPQQALIFPAVLTLFAALGSYNHHLPILQHAGILQTLQSKETVDAINYAESHRGQTYLVNHTDPYAAGWLAFHVRDSKAYLTPPRLADFSLNKAAYEFTKVPDYLPGMILLSQTGVHSQDASGGVPTFDVSNPQGEERDTADVWYWLADTLDININRWDNDPRPVEYKFKVRVDPGPSNPSLYRKMRMTNSRTGIASIIETNAGQTPVVPVILAPGRNSFFLELIEPTQATVNLPHDPRRLMVRLINPSISDPRPIEKPDPALLRAIASGVPATPQLTAVNPQGEDKSNITSWFWVAQNMDLQIRRTDSDPADHIYQLNFRAGAGFANPDPTRTIRLTHVETGTETILKLTAPALLSATLNLKPGLNNVKLELVNAPPQTVKAPGDLRVHMLRVEEFGLRFLRANSDQPPATAKPTTQTR